jgi:sugar phosphate isomerase/epimerase
MAPASPIARPLGTMVAYGFARGHIDTDLALALRLGASCLEILPDWRAFPSALDLRSRVSDRGLAVHSAHGCWGGTTIRADRVDLGHPDPAVQAPGIDDLKRCVDWLRDAGGTCLVVHPGGLSDPEQTGPRRAALARGLLELADHTRGSGVIVCVENMPLGVHPGSRMADLTGLVDELDRPELALAIDTGHANMTANAADETLAAGTRLRTTHVHDNNSQQDSHDPPGLGTVDWDAWRNALDAIGYTGPIMLECIRHLRMNPESLNEPLLRLLDRLTSGARPSG